MSTFHSFNRSLKPFVDFDGEEDASEMGHMALVPTKTTEISSYVLPLFITAILDHYCSLHAGNSKNSMRMKEKLFHDLCEVLVKERLMSPAWSSSEFASIRHMYKKQFLLFVDAAVKSVNQDLLVTSSRIADRSIQPFLSSRGQITLSVENTIPSKLTGEFCDVEKIGKGAYGKVYKATKKSESRTYAVKEIVFKADDHCEVQKTFNEVKLLAGLSHPNIIRYYDNWVETTLSNYVGPPADDDLDSDCSDASPKYSQQSKGDFFGVSVAEELSESFVVFQEDDEKVQHGDSQALVCRNVAQLHYSHQRSQTRLLKSALVLYIQMELCQNTLENWIETRNWPPNGQQVTISNEENKRLFRQILKGVKYIHSQGLIHRDLKPQNIFLQCNDQGSYLVKIGDFGLATLTAARRNDSLAEGSTSHVGDRGDYCGYTDGLTKGVGTLSYSSPEQQNNTYYNSKSDMYSLGVILYELYHPFGTGRERADCLVRLRKHRVLEDKLKENWPQQAEVVDILISEDPDQRPSADELLQNELFHPKEQILSELRNLRQQNSELHQELRWKDQQLRNKDNRIAELERLLKLRSET